MEDRFFHRHPPFWILHSQSMAALHGEIDREAMREQPFARPGWTLFVTAWYRE
jgi:hypothetical protein